MKSTDPSIEVRCLKLAATIAATNGKEYLAQAYRVSAEMWRSREGRRHLRKRYPGIYKVAADWLEENGKEFARVHAA